MHHIVLSHNYCARFLLIAPRNNTTLQRNIKICVLGYLPSKYGSIESTVTQTCGVRQIQIHLLNQYVTDF